MPALAEPLVSRLLQDWIRRLRVLLQQGASVEGSPEEQQLSMLMNQYAHVSPAPCKMWVLRKQALAVQKVGAMTPSGSYVD